jgi:hypothetical protein
MAANPGTEPAQATAASQTLISYQGMLTDPSGNPINDTLPMEFALYDAASEGNLKWGPEIQSVQVGDGLFHVLLGSVEPINFASVPSELYLDIRVNGEPLSPRELLGDVAYAMEAGRVPLIWFPSYDSRGVRTGLPGFLDTLYYATARGITVSANRAPDDGSLSDMFNLSRGSYARWNNVSPTNPVVITTNYTGDGPYLNGVLMAFGWRNSQAIDYTIEYYEDGDDDGTYMWRTVADVTGNMTYEVYHAVANWGVSKIRITVTDAGDGSADGSLRIATIQAPSAIHGKPTGPMLDIGGDKMYGKLDMNGKSISGVSSLAFAGDFHINVPTDKHGGFWDNKNGNYILQVGSDTQKIRAFRTLNMNGNSVTNCGALTEANLQTKEELIAERIDRFEEGDVLCWAGERLEKCDTADDPLIQAVADADGRPIVIGAEVIKVLGLVSYGDLLVASDVPGYAMVNNDPRPGAVIAQALENFDGEQGIIKAMIRKF